MTVSTAFLSLMVLLALAVTVVAPVALLVMLWRDWKKGQLW